MTYDFSKFKKDELTKPRDKAWDNWAKFEKVGDKVQGFIVDVFYRPVDGDFADARGITLENEAKELVNVSIKRFPFILAHTNDLRMGDPLTVVFSEQKAPVKKGHSGVKVFEFYGTNLPENVDNPTVLELDLHDRKNQNVAEVEEEEEEGEDDFLPPEETVESQA